MHMKTFTIALVIMVLSEITAPPLARSVGLGGGGGGHPGGMGRGGVGTLNPAGPSNRVGPFDRDGSFDHRGMRDHDRGFHGQHRFERFGFPICPAYAYCPSPVGPCEWQDGYWTVQPFYDEYGDETLARVWIPGGCY